jgi:hypothetical protein
LFSADFASDLRTRRIPEAERPNYGGREYYRPQRPANETAGQALRAGNAPDNLIYANPQFIGGGAQLRRNEARSHYHSMQAQVTMRPTYGLSLQATWTWSRSISTSGPLDYREGPDFWKRDTNISSSHRGHTLSTYGTYELPFGARGFLFRDASGWLKKSIEGWQLGWIGRLSTGAPMSISGYSTVWTTNRAEQVGPFDPKDVGIKWQSVEPGVAPYATYFNKAYTWVEDPQCYNPQYVRQDVNRNPYVSGSSAMNTYCGVLGSGRNALAEVVGYEEQTSANGTVTMIPIPGQIIFQNSVPGVIGNKRGNFIMSPGSWSLDMSMSKAIEFMEGKRFELRVDAQNIFNHPSPSYTANPGSTYPTYFGARTTGTANPGNITLTRPSSLDRFFGEVNAKAGHRTFQARLSLRF